MRSEEQVARSEEQVLGCQVVGQGVFSPAELSLELGGKSSGLGQLLY